jgi:hypothetical protein
MLGRLRSDAEADVRDVSMHKILAGLSNITRIAAHSASQQCALIALDDETGERSM